MNLIPPIEKESIAAIEKWQTEKLQALAIYLESNSPFYKAHFAKHSISAKDFVSLDHLNQVPPTTKEDLQLNNFGFLCVPPTKVAEYMSTSGTLGSPVTIALTKNDLERLAYNEFISFACAGATREDTFQLALTLDRQFMAGIAYYSGIQKLNASLIRTGPGFPAMQLEVMQKLRPSVLVAVPSFILKLIDEAEANNVKLRELSVKKIVAIGETIRNADFSFNTLGERIKKSWEVELMGTYASTEMQTAFTECEHGRGGHLHPELIIVEILDDAGKKLSDGEVGEVTITTLGVEGMPLLRYRTGDISFVQTDACKCGRNTLRLGPILGRKKQMIKIKGTTVYPSSLFNILSRAILIGDYAVEVVSGLLQTDEIIVYILPKERKQEEAIQEIKNLFQSFLKVLPQIQTVSLNELEKIQTKSSSRKINRFIDSRAGSYFKTN